MSPFLRAILHDPSVYPDPFAFKPERFSDHETNTLAGINDIPDAAFGFGRRYIPLLGPFIALISNTGCALVVGSPFNPLGLLSHQFSPYTISPRQLTRMVKQ
jgi:hypothetical protein